MAHWAIQKEGIKPNTYFPPPLNTKGITIPNRIRPESLLIAIPSTLLEDRLTISMAASIPRTADCRDRLAMIKIESTDSLKTARTQKDTSPETAAGKASRDTRYPFLPIGVTQR